MALPWPLIPGTHDAPMAIHPGFGHGYFGSPSCPDMNMGRPLPFADLDHGYCQSIMSGNRHGPAMAIQDFWPWVLIACHVRTWAWAGHGYS